MEKENRYADGLRLLGGRKFLGMLITAAFMLLIVLLVFFRLPAEARAWDFLDAAWPGFLLLVGFYMGIDVTSKFFGGRAGSSKGGENG